MARARFSPTFAGSSPEPRPQLSDLYMPSLTPPLRVRKPWRSRVLSVRALAVIIVSLESRWCRQARRGDRQRLEQGAHLREVEQASARAHDVLGLRLRRVAHQHLRALMQAEPLQQLALRYRSIGF